MIPYEPKPPPPAQGPLGLPPPPSPEQVLAWVNGMVRPPDYVTAPLHEIFPDQVPYPYDPNAYPK